MDTAKLLTIFIQAGSFISAFAAIAGGIIMATATKKFGTGILASGFKTISIGVLFVAIGIFIDAIYSYIQLSGIIMNAIIVAKEIFFIIGTYAIVIGSKKTGDKLESLTQ